jgi:spermidine/putrescine transport system ATP-binding protein
MLGCVGNVNAASVTSVASRTGIEIKGLTRRYGSVAAVDELDLSIAPGEFFTLLGPSGCGKSTTLRIVAGLEDPTRGTVQLGAEDVTSTAPERRDVSMVFQDYALFPHMNVLENVRFPLRMKHVSKTEGRARALEMLAIVGLAGMGDRRPDQISGGQRQRAALARSLVWQPKALLLDEPLAALDYQLRQGMQTMLKDLQRQVGITFLYVTHDQTEAFAMSDRLGVMRDGRLEQVGTPRELYDRPENLFVATFIGRTNLVSGSVLATDGHRIRIQVGEAVIDARTPSWQPAERTRVLVGVRPEFVGWTADEGVRTGLGSNMLTGRITQMTFHGSTVETCVELPSGETWRCVCLGNAPAPSPAADGRIGLTWEPDRSLVFQPEEVAASDSAMTDLEHRSPSGSPIVGIGG